MEAWSLQAAQTAVLLMSSAMLVLQVYLSVLEYQKHEYIQVPEESSLSKVALPMITVCPEKPYKTNFPRFFFAGFDSEARQFVGWSRDNKTTKEYLESFVTNEIENTSSSVEALFSESIVRVTEGQKLGLRKLRITYYYGQCFAISLPQKPTWKMWLLLSTSYFSNLTGQKNKQINTLNLLTENILKQSFVTCKLHLKYIFQV